jgi:hypothetical protein
MELAGLSLIKLDVNTVIKPFDCGDEDLNDFLSSKAKLYLQENLAVTYLIEGEAQTVAFFSIFNDSLKVEESFFASKSALKETKGKIPVRCILILLQSSMRPLPRTFHSERRNKPTS